MSPFIQQQRAICVTKCEASDVKDASMPEFSLQEGGRKFEKGISRTAWNSEKDSRPAISGIHHRSSKASGQQEMDSRVTESHFVAYSEVRMWTAG
jgi:hypothetical protein